MKLSLIIPAYNEEQVIATTIARIQDVFEKHNYDCELIFINDGSSDNTLQVLKNFKALDSRIRIIQFSRNFGHQAAVTAGIKNCTGDYAVILDADLQDPPEEIPFMLDKAIKENANVVFGVRQSRKGETWFKKLTAGIFYRFINYLSETSIPLDTGDFRLIDKKVIQAFNSLSEKQKYVRGLISWVGYKQLAHHYNRDARAAGETHYPLSKMFSLAFKGIFYFSKKPLLVAVNLGLLCLLVGLGLILYVLYSKYFDPSHTISGWSSLSIIIIFFGGVQLLSVGLLGQYISSIFEEVKNRPEYIIDEIF